MAQQLIAFSPESIARGRILAESRLAYLTELYESGRWKRYFSDLDFVENACAAREALDTWCRLDQFAPNDMDPAQGQSIEPDDTFTLAPSDVEGDEAIDQDWHQNQDLWLPAVEFSANGVGAERDLSGA
jgi:uncharacterized repeat protein (TIGR03809 family)